MEQDRIDKIERLANAVQGLDKQAARDLLEIGLERAPMNVVSSALKCVALHNVRLVPNDYVIPVKARPITNGPRHDVVYRFTNDDDANIGHNLAASAFLISMRLGESVFPDGWNAHGFLRHMKDRARVRLCHGTKMNTVNIFSIFGSEPFDGWYEACITWLPGRFSSYFLKMEFEVPEAGQPYSVPIDIVLALRLK